MSTVWIKCRSDQCLPFDSNTNLSSVCLLSQMQNLICVCRLTDMQTWSMSTVWLRYKIDLCLSLTPMRAESVSTFLLKYKPNIMNNFCSLFHINWAVKFANPNDPNFYKSCLYVYVYILSSFPMCFLKLCIKDKTIQLFIMVVNTDKN